MAVLTATTAPTSGSTYAIELTPAILTPFEWSATGANSLIQGIVPSLIGETAFSNDNSGMDATQLAQAGYLTSAQGNGSNVGYYPQATTTNTPTGLNTTPDAGNPLYPLFQTGGLVFPYNPGISESLATKYDVTEMVHTNENIHTFKNTDNTRITLSECVWTSETFDQAIYTLGVIHFLRSYRLMDFGRGKSGRPPSPMWFSAYGAYLYNAVPVLIERADFNFPTDVDYVGVPNPGTADYNNQILNYATGISSPQAFSMSGDFTWIPIKFVVSSISMVVQHSVTYWTTQFSLANFKAGLMTNVR